MEKSISTRTTITLSPEPANAGHETRPQKDYRRWWAERPWLDTPAHWRKASMKQAFSTWQPAGEPGTPWHEVACMKMCLQHRIRHNEDWKELVEQHIRK